MVLTIIFGDPLAEYFAFFASVATVVGIVSVWWTYRKRSVSSKWREQVGNFSLCYATVGHGTGQVFV